MKMTSEGPLAASPAANAGSMASISSASGRQSQRLRILVIAGAAYLFRSQG